MIYHLRGCIGVHQDQDQDQDHMGRRVIDTFIFYNEIDMLKTRISELDPVVDLFVIVESDVTHVGKRKPAFAQEAIRTDPWFEPFLPKIRLFLSIGITDEAQPSLNAWVRENAQRNSIQDALKTLVPTVQPEDIIIMSDADEIPDPNTLRLVPVHFGDQPIPPHVFEQKMYYYSMKYRSTDPWYGSIFASYDEFQKQVPQRWRNMRNMLPRIANGGRHCSFFGDVEFIKNKLKNYPHQEYNTEFYTSDDHIHDAIMHGKDLFIRDDFHLEEVECVENK